MRKYILYLIVLCPFIASAQQKLFTETGYLTSHPWKILSVETKSQADDEYSLLAKDRANPCLYSSVYYFNTDGSLQLKVDKTKCNENDTKGKWKFAGNYTKLILDVEGSEEALILDVLKIGEMQIALETTVKDEKLGTFWQRVVLEPLQRKAVFITELQTLVKLTAANHSTKARDMGFTQNGFNSAEKYYSYKNGNNGELKMYFDENGKCKSVVYYSYTRLPQNYIWEFSNDNTCYFVSSIERKPAGSEKKWRTDKHYKNGFLFEANEQNQTFSAYKPTEEDIKDLTKNYPNTKFPELQVQQQRAIQQEEQTQNKQPIQQKQESRPVAIMTDANFCKELTVVLNAMGSGELEKLVDYNKPLGITRSWYAAKVPMSGFVDAEGQDMFGYLTFDATLDGSDNEKNEEQYRDLVRMIEACVGKTYSKKKEDTSTKFINKNNEGLTITVHYWGKGKSIRLTVVRTSGS